eukprot:1791222-Rhodomonas_salina.3
MSGTHVDYAATSPRPAMEYDWGLPIWMEVLSPTPVAMRRSVLVIGAARSPGLSPFYEYEDEIMDMPRIPNEEYGTLPPCCPTGVPPFRWY